MFSFSIVFFIVVLCLLFNLMTCLSMSSQFTLRKAYTFQLVCSWKPVPCWWKRGMSVFFADCQKLKNKETERLCISLFLTIQIDTLTLWWYTVTYTFAVWSIYSPGDCTYPFSHSPFSGKVSFLCYCGQFTLLLSPLLTSCSLGIQIYSQFTIFLQQAIHVIACPHSQH